MNPYRKTVLVIVVLGWLLYSGIGYWRKVAFSAELQRQMDVHRFGMLQQQEKILKAQLDTQVLGNAPIAERQKTTDELSRVYNDEVLLQRQLARR